MDVGKVTNRVDRICSDLGWDSQVVMEILLIALEERQFCTLKPSKEEWSDLRQKKDILNLLGKRLEQRTCRSWTLSELREFRERVEQEYQGPTRQPVSLEATLQLLFNKEQVCVLCGMQGNDMIPEIDHRKPVNKGGSSKYSNLQWLCRACNRKKQDKIGKEWGNG